jgi:hypothetical protein
MADETTGVKITQNAIYAKQLEHGETLIKILQKLDHLDDVPDRLREVELTLARLADREDCLHRTFRCTCFNHRINNQLRS